MAHVEIDALDIKIFNILAFDLHKHGSEYLVSHLYCMARDPISILEARSFECFMGRLIQDCVALRNKDATHGDRLLDTPALLSGPTAYSSAVNEFMPFYDYITSLILWLHLVEL